MELSKNEEKALSLLGEYLAAEKSLKTGKDVLSENDYIELEIVMSNIDVIAMDSSDSEIDGRTDNAELTEEERLLRQKEIRNFTQREYSELIDAYRKCLNGDCVEMQKMRDEIFEKL